MRKWLTRAVVGAGVAAAMVVTTGPGAMAAVDTARQPQTIVGVGSDNLYELMNDLDQLYNESPGCAIIPTSGTFTNYGQRCLDPGTLSYAIDYGQLIQTENLYHDMITEAYPVGSGNGLTVLTKFLTGDANATLQADFNRRSANTTTATIGTSPDDYNLYETAFATAGWGVWVGKNNTLVYPHTAGKTPKPVFLTSDLLNVWEPNGSGACEISWSGSQTDSIAATHKLTSAYTDANSDGIKDTTGGNIVVYATQAGSGTGTSFDQFLNNITSGGSAANLQGCIPDQFKNGVLTDGEHVIFENIANPICHDHGPGGGALNNRAKAIFPYAFHRFVQNQAGTLGGCTGVLGKLDPDGGASGQAPVAPSAAHIGSGLYPYTGKLYDYFPVPVCKTQSGGSCTQTYATAGFDVTDKTTWDILPDKWEAVLDYLQPVDGWLCKTTAKHSADPVTGVNFRAKIESVMTADGVAPISSGSVGGSTFSGTSNCRSTS